MRKLLTALVGLLCLWIPILIVTAEQIVGQASVIDGDTIEIHGTRIRFHGIDAPESGQVCMVHERRLRCGKLAGQVLAKKIGSDTVTCIPTDQDRYGRVVAICSVTGEDLNAWMVREGWALAYRQYSLDYINEENSASASGRRLWNTEFTPPWEWRRRKHASVSQQSSGPSPQSGCNIKGNINRKGERIYHIPGGHYYDGTVITASKSERWFCSEMEAKTAGWRRSKQ